MLRRDFMRSVASVVLVPKALLAKQGVSPAPPPPAPVPWTLGLTAKTPLPVTVAADEAGEIEVTFLNPAQLSSFIRLCDLLLPPLGNKPGAIQAGTPLFLDALIGSSPAARQELYTGGLDWLAREATERYKLPFAHLSEIQADALIRPWLRTWMTDHPPTEAHAAFINIAHEDIRMATINSKEWNDASAAADQDWVTGGLYWSPIEPDMGSRGLSSAHLRQVTAAPKAEHVTPSYPQ